MGRPPKFQKIVEKYFELKPWQTGICQVYVCKFCNHEMAKNFYRMVRHVLVCQKVNMNIEERKDIMNLCNNNGKKTGVDVDNSDNNVIYLFENQNNDHFVDTDLNLTEYGSAKVHDDDRVTPSTFNSINCSFTSNTNNIDTQQLPSTSACSSRTSTSYKTRTDQLDNFIDRMCAKEKDEIWECLARACFATGTPLDFTENSYWKMVLKKLRPSLQLPSSFQISNNLLDKEYERIQHAVDEKILSAKYLSIRLDGWSNLRCEPIINVIVCTPEPLIFKIIDTSGHQHTSEYMVQIIQEVLKEIGSEKIISVVADNANNMSITDKLIKQAYPKQPLNFYGCVAHILDLFIGDVLGVFMEIQEKAKIIVKKINYSQTIRPKFEKIQKDYNCTTSLQLPIKTKWTSTVSCLKSLLDNTKPLEMLVVTSSDLDGELSQIIVDKNGFWRAIQIVYKLLDCVRKWITILEADECRILFVLAAFKEIEEMINRVIDDNLQFNTQKIRILNSLNKRKECAVHKIHKAAHFLDPRTKGNLLSFEEIADVIEFIVELGDFIIGENYRCDVASEIAMYRNNKGFFQKKFIWDSLKSMSNGSNIDPITWWQGLCDSTSLSKIAVVILQCPPTSGSIDRSFSSFVHCNKKNRLTNLQSRKLLFINHNLKKLSDDTEKSFFDFNDPGREYVSHEEIDNEIEQQKIEVEMEDFETITFEVVKDEGMKK